MNKCPIDHTRSSAENAWPPEKDRDDELVNVSRVCAVVEVRRAILRSESPYQEKSVLVNETGLCN